MNPEKPEYNIHENTEDVSESPNTQELREFTRKYSPIARDDLAHEIKLAKVRKELGIISKDEELESVTELRDQFRERFEQQKDLFSKESLDSRSVEIVSKEKGIIFVHTIPLDGIEQEANTQMNNKQVFTRLMNTKERIGTIINKKPSISCSTLEMNGLIKYGINPEKGGKTMYPFGIVINKGTILSANRFDSGTVAISRTAKHRKYDLNEPDTSIQPKIEAQIKYSTEGPFSKSEGKRFVKEHGHIDGMGGALKFMDYNEFTVAEPEISGFFIDEDLIKFKEDVYGPMYWDEIIKYFDQYPDVPIYIKKDNNIVEFVYKDKKLSPVHIEGTFEYEKPTKKLSNYDWESHSDKAETEARKYSAEIKISMDNLSKLIKRSTYIHHIHNTEWMDIVLELLKIGSITEDEIHSAVRSDFENQLEKTKKMMRDTKDFIAKEMRSNLFNSKSSMYAVYKRTIYAIPKIISEFAEKLKSEGHDDLAEKILNIKK